MTDRLVLQDYSTPRLNGGGPATWVAGDVVDLSDDDAAWVGRDAPGTLDDTEQETAPEPEPEAGLTDTEREADEQAAAARKSPTKSAPSGRGRRKDSAD